MHYKPLGSIPLISAINFAVPLKKSLDAQPWRSSLLLISELKKRKFLSFSSAPIDLCIAIFMHRRFQRRVVEAVDKTIRSFTRVEAQSVLNEGHHRLQQANFQKVASSLGCSGPNLLHPHLTPSPLSSASLLASYIKHRIIRNMEHLSSTVIRRTLDFVSERHPAWQHDTDQSARKIQCMQIVRRLENQENILLLQLEFDTKNQALTEQLEEIRETLRKLRLVIQCMEESVRGNLHPSNLQQGEAAFLTPAEAAQLPSPIGAIRGIRIRIKGPRRGTRCAKWEKTAGRVSINSVKFVAAEEAKVPIPSKVGVFGLNVRIVYTKTNRLVDPLEKINVLDQPNFSFASHYTCDSSLPFLNSSS